MGLATDVEGNGKLLHISSEIRTWIESDAFTYHEVRETVTREEREWYALDEDAIIGAISSHEDKVDPSDYPTKIFRATDYPGAFDFPKETGVDTALTRGEKVYWDDFDEVATAIMGSFVLIGYVCEDAGDDDDQVIVAMAYYTQHATLTEPVIGAYTLTRHIESKVREYTEPF